MEFVPFQNSNPPGVVEIAAAFAYISLCVTFVSAIGNWGKASVIAVCIGFIVMIGSVTTLVVFSSDGGAEEWKADQASKLSSHYGVEITVENLDELEYPLEITEDTDYLGTTPIQTGENLSDFNNVTLAVKDNKVYLFTQVDAEYVELEPVSK